MARRSIPKDSKGSVVQVAPAVPALAQLVSASISSSTTRNLNASTTFIQVYAKDKGIYLKWGSTAVTNANFDEYIPANQRVDLYVPIELATGALYTTMRVLEEAATATIVLIEK